MSKIAETFCEAWKLPVQIRYFYCSRYSLRLPLLTVDKNYRADKCFDGVSEDGSNNSLEAAQGYFEQEFRGIESFAIVDTGWLGTTQECVARLFEMFFSIASDTLQGYYFGALRRFDPKYGQCSTFMFASMRESSKLAGFSVELFECLCAATHGTTLGYERKNGKWAPVLDDCEEGQGSKGWNAAAQMLMCQKYAEHFAEHNTFSTGTASLRPVAASLIRGFMRSPSLAEAELYGKINFRDAFASDAVMPLARKLSKDEISRFTLTGRLAGAIRRRGQPSGLPMHWLFGSLALSGCGPIRRMDAHALEYLYRLVKG
jgi:hypothetical protein